MANQKYLFYLLVGINDYPSSPLRGCVNDVEKIEAYLGQPHVKNAFSGIKPKKLLDEQASKKAVVAAVKDHLGQATDDDVVFFYYSGHGANEQTGGRFKDELDGLLECLVCHYSKKQESGFLLADKELRFLFSGFEHSPHIVTVFDACHAGDMTRAVEGDERDTEMKRLTKNFDPRPYEEFIFASHITSGDLASSTVTKLIPNKNHVHLAGCLPHESSWEKNGNGVFTTYLLELLDAMADKVRYQDIARYAKLSLRDQTETQQTPTINVVGEGKLTHLSTWLDIHDDSSISTGGSILHHHEDGWIFTSGSFLGIREGMRLTIHKGMKQIKTKVTKVRSTYSEIAQPPGSGRWEKNKTYKATTPTTHTILKVYINDEDNDVFNSAEEGPDVYTRDIIESIVEEMENVENGSREEATFYINLFNQLIYISKKGDPYRPIAMHYNLLEKEGGRKVIKDFLQDQIKYVIRWNHFKTLENPIHPFDGTNSSGQKKGPLQILFHEDGNLDQPLTSDAVFSAITDEEKVLESIEAPNGIYYNSYRIRVKNTTSKALYLAVLRLGSDMAVDAYFNDEVIRLEPSGKTGDTVTIYPSDPEETRRPIHFYDSQIVYNWAYEEIIFRFIVNTASFTAALKDFQQPGLEEAYLPDSFRENRRGDDSFGFLQTQAKKVEEKWDVYSCTLKLENPTYNQISGSLKSKADEVVRDELLAPFISKLYYNQKINGFNVALDPNPDVHRSSGSKGLKDDILWKLTEGFMAVGNAFDDFQRKRKFKRTIRNLPNQPAIVAEGDSWFLFPLILKDTLDFIMEMYPLRSLAAAGDTLENYRRESSSNVLNVALEKDEAANYLFRYVLLSGGGNDILLGKLDEVVKDMKGSSSEEMAVEFDQVIDGIENHYRYFFDHFAGSDYGHIEKIIVHGYDYILEEEPVRKGLLDILIDRFNDILIRLSDEYDKVFHLDLRGVVSSDKNLWFDGIHPNKAGYGRVAHRFIAKIDEFNNELGIK